jgi:DNA mismatch repair protein MLH1
MEYFIFPLFSLQIDPRSVDVNVHPTKREVHFLNEEAIVERISDALQEALAVQSHSRVFEYQVRLLSCQGSAGISCLEVY